MAGFGPEQPQGGADGHPAGVTDSESAGSGEADSSEPEGERPGAQLGDSEEAVEEAAGEAVEEVVEEAADEAAEAAAEEADQSAEEEPANGDGASDRTEPVQNAETAQAPAEPSEQADEGPSIDELELQLVARSERIADLEDKVLRGRADLENLRRRSAREQEEARRFGVEKLLKELLPVVDNLGRALDHATRGGEGDLGQLNDGVQMVQRQFLDTMVRFGVQAFESEGRPFDPNLHEAVHRRETAEAAPGTVVEVFQTGYMIHDRLARPAMVIVAMAPAVAVVEETEVAEEAEEAAEEVEAAEAPTTAEASEATEEGVEAAEEAEPAKAVETAEESEASTAENVAEAPILDDAALAAPREEAAGASVIDAPAEILGYYGETTGAVVVEIRAMTPAERAGLQPGDLVLNAAGRVVTDARSFSRAVRTGLKRSPSVRVVYSRGQELAQETTIGRGRR